MITTKQRENDKPCMGVLEYEEFLNLLELQRAIAVKIIRTTEPQLFKNHRISKSALRPRDR